MARDDVDRAARRLDTAVDRFADRIGARQMELLLQERAQDMRRFRKEDGFHEGGPSHPVGGDADA